MNALPLTELAAHVVAWHNRHPLARRISVAQVHSMGFVVLPFVAGSAAAGVVPAPAPSPSSSGQPSATAEGATLRERAIAKAKRDASVTAAAPSTAAAASSSSPASVPDTPDTLEAAFSEDLMPTLSAAKVARWVKRHGMPTPAPVGDAPVRQVKPDPGIDSSRLSTLWVQTVQVEAGQQRVRVLVAPGSAGAVLGARLWSRPRAAGLATLALAVIALAVIALGFFARSSTPPAAVAPLVSPAGLAASASTAVPAKETGALPPTLAANSVPAHAPASASSATPASAPGHGREARTNAAAQAAVAPASAAPAADRPVDVEASLGRVQLPSLGPRIDRRRQAQQLANGPAAPRTAATPVSPDPARTALELPAAPAPSKVAASAPSKVVVAASVAPAAAAPSKVAASAPSKVAVAASVATAAAAPSKVAASAPSKVAVAAPSTEANPAPPKAAAPPAPPKAATAASPAAAVAAAVATAQPGSPSSRAAFALSTRLLRTRTESHQMADALRALLLTTAAPHRKVQVLSEGEDYRVVAGPYDHRAEAEQLQAQLAARGLKVRVIDF